MPHPEIDGSDGLDYLYEIRLDALIDELVSGTSIQLEGSVTVDHNHDFAVAVFEHDDFATALIDIAKNHPKSKLYEIMKAEAQRLCENALDDEKDALVGVIDDSYDEDEEGV